MQSAPIQRNNQGQTQCQPLQGGLWGAAAADTSGGRTGAGSHVLAATVLDMGVTAFPPVSLESFGTSF